MTRDELIKIGGKAIRDGMPRAQEPRQPWERAHVAAFAWTEHDTARAVLDAILPLITADLMEKIDAATRGGDCADCCIPVVFDIIDEEAK